MHTYTHAAISAAIGAFFFAHEPLVQAACLAGAVLPDMPMIILFGLDRLAGRPALNRQPLSWIEAKNIFQSAFLWFPLWLVGLHFSRSPLGALALAFGVNGLVHVVVDYFTHGDPEFSSKDGFYTWPFEFVIPRYMGWDYRRSVGQLWPPKPFEAWLLVGLAIATIIGWWPR